MKLCSYLCQMIVEKYPKRTVTQNNFATRSASQVYLTQNHHCCAKQLQIYIAYHHTLSMKLFCVKMICDTQFSVGEYFTWLYSSGVKYRLSNKDYILSVLDRLW